MKVNSDRIYALDVYKFFMSLVIIILHSNWEYCPQGYLAVESFFLVSGFCLALSWDKKNITWVEYIKHKLLSIYPMYILTIIVMAIVDGLHDSYLLFKQLPLYVLMLQCIGVKGMEYNYVQSLGHLWYIPVYMLVSTVIVFLLSKLRKDNRIWVLGIIFICALSMIVYNSPSGGVNYSIEKFTSWIPIGYLRGFMSMSLGVVVGQIFGGEKKIHMEKNVKLVAATIAELAIILYMIWILFRTVTVEYDYCYIVAAACWIGLLYSNIGLISRCLNYVGSINGVQKVTQLSVAVYFIHFLFVNEYCRKVGTFVPIHHIPIIIILSLIGGVFMNILSKKINVTT